MFRIALALLLSIACFGAENKTSAPKDKDLCAPPPGAVAPWLPAKLMTGQGNVHFPITTSSREAQEFFDQGVSQMHSFWAVEAERSFLQAAALDPTAPMPQWGVAMVAAGDYRPHFQLEGGPREKSVTKQNLPEGGLKRAVEAAKKAQELAAVPGKATDKEKLYIAAIAARRNLSSADPDSAYIAGLRAVAAAFPDEVEAKSYLALHLMRGFTTPERKPREGSMEAVAILRDLVQKFPDHPGVHHYIIHGFEGATFASDAWPSCRRYPELAPNIPHALHMPGHIWAQTGKWDEAAHSFEDAAANELGYIRADALYGTGHHGHNVEFLITTYDFKGDYDKAMSWARELLEFKKNPHEAAQVDNPYIAFRQGWFGILRTLVFFDKWDEILDGKTLPAFDKPREQVWRHWAMALAHANKGEIEEAKAESRLMNECLADLAARTKSDVPAPLSVARKELDGQLAIAEHKTGKGLKLLEEAARMERALRYTEPPSYPRPVFEVLGRAALQAGKPEMAAAAFRETLNQYPGFPRVLAAQKSVAAGGL